MGATATIPMTIDGNSLVPTTENGAEELHRLRNEEVLSVTIKTTDKRTLNQNNYYWGVVVQTILERFEEYGYTLNDLFKNAPPVKLLKTDVHEWLKVVFNREDIVDESTAEVKGVRQKSTSSTGKHDFGEYIERIRLWASDYLDIYIRDPDTERSSKGYGIT